MLAYIDPNQGYVFIQNTPFLWEILAALLSFCGISLVSFRRWWKKGAWSFVLLLFIIMGGVYMLCRPSTDKKVIVIGIDAMDPRITEELLRQKRLPHLAQIRSRGSYARLRTTIPAASAVAWTTFMTGRDPGDHGIFDFITRDPATYGLSLSFFDIDPGTSKLSLNRRFNGEPFWAGLSRKHIPCYIYFCPNTFPPRRLFGRILAGMGTPDITGTMGTYSFYTSAEPEENSDSRGRIIFVPRDGHEIKTELYGPLRMQNGVRQEMTASLRIDLDLKKKVATLYVDDSVVMLREQEWSPWVSVRFGGGFFGRKYGIVRFYLKSLSPQFALYASPVNAHPGNPLFQISFPKDLSKRLARDTGLYYTQGMPHDTWAFSENRLDEKAFLRLCDSILDEKRRILAHELKRFNRGVFFFYFDTLDVIQHMFWDSRDGASVSGQTAGPYRGVIERYYERMDQVIGEVMRSADDTTTLLILSDHGFASFRRAAHINRWLLEQGYLVLRSGQSRSKELFASVDWSRTQAYAAGFGGVYINRIGRESSGIVSATDVPELKKRITEQLHEWRDPLTGEKIVNHVYDSDDVFTGSYQDTAPDLYIGFIDGYRASWQTALGAVPEVLIEDNVKKWSGDHLVDPALVPGIVASNSSISLKDMAMKDIAGTILKLFRSDD